ncbi:hypothetical protein F5X96DRAFT_617652 [Biscogniauxia mediterranea]|nr:hypothetical protein F5X96DRAFT_617652 [Biscogniauxia mediterranea]
MFSVQPLVFFCLGWRVCPGFVLLSRDRPVMLLAPCSILFRYDALSLSPTPWSLFSLLSLAYLHSNPRAWFVRSMLRCRPPLLLFKSSRRVKIITTKKTSFHLLPISVRREKT